MQRDTQIAVRIAAWVFLCLGVGFLSGWLTRAGVADWYPTLAKPSFNPPAWVFAPVWTALYVAMGVAAGLVHGVAGARAARGALALFGLQLVLNAAWSAFFFGLRNPALALADIVVLLGAIAVTLLAFRRLVRAAAWLLVPYAAWVAFATVLNAAIVLLN
jgi:tryptophan-rich sensory protein